MSNEEMGTIVSPGGDSRASQLKTLAASPAKVNSLQMFINRFVTIVIACCSP